MVSWRKLFNKFLFLKSASPREGRILFFIFIPWYQVSITLFIHYTLTLLDPCYKTGYLTCKTYKSRRTLVVETLDRTRNQGTISCPPARTPEKRPRAPFEIRSFLVETMQLKRSCIRIKLDSTIPRPFPHHLLPLIKKPTVNREPLSSQAAKLFPRYNFRYF